MLKLLKGVLCTLFLSFPAYFLYLILFTPLKVSDLTSDRISLLANRPVHIEKDIVVDLTMIDTNGGMATYAEEVMKYMINKHHNYRWIVLYNKVCGNKSFKDFLDEHAKRSNNILFISIEPMAKLSTLIFYYMKSKSFVFLEQLFSRLLSTRSEKMNDMFYRIKQVTLYEKLFVDRHCDLIFSLGTPHFCLGFGIPQVSVIHDIVQIDNQKLTLPHEYDLYQRIYTNNFNSSTKLISISNFTKSCIIKHFNNIDCNKIEVIRTQMANRLPHINKNQKIKILNKFNLQEGKYFVFASKFWPHKNHSRLAEAFAKMLQKYEIDNDFKLVFMGDYKSSKGKPFKTTKKAINVIKNNDITNRVVFTGYTTNEEFNALMSGSLAVVNPSLYEGFGMPVAEAMLLEKPVVCSNVASLPEVGGDAALYFDPYNIDDMADKLYQVYSNKELRKSMIEKGKIQVKNFTNKEKMLKDISDLLDKTMAESANNKYKIDWNFCSVK